MISSELIKLMKRYSKEADKLPEKVTVWAKGELFQVNTKTKKAKKLDK